MKLHTQSCSPSMRVLGVFSACVAMVGVIAQTPPASAKAMTEMTVTDESRVAQQPDRPNGLRIRVFSKIEEDYDRPDGFRRKVAVADIDFAAPDAARILTQRVRDAASSGCNRLYHHEPPASWLRLRKSCFQASVRDAMPQVDRLIRMARNGELSSSQVAVTLLE